MSNDHDYVPVARIELPDDWTPEGQVCMLIPVPDDPQFISMLVGHIDQLKYSASFARDGTKTGASIVARRWQEALDSQPLITVNCEGEITMFNVRQNTTDPCILEKSTDGGATWVEWADLTLCPPNVVLSSDGTKILWLCPNCGPGGTPEWVPVPMPGVEDYDPAFDDPQTPVEEGWVEPGNDPACVYAANLVEAFKSIYERLDFALQTGTLSTVVYIEAMLQVVAKRMLTKKAKEILDLLAGTSVFSYAEWNADYTATDWQEMIDKLACFYQEDGTVSRATFDTELACLDDMTGPIWTVTKAIIALVGTNGLNNAADFAGIHEATCDPDCCECDECIMTFDAGGCAYTLIRGTLQAGGVSGNCIRSEFWDSGASGSARYQQRIIIRIPIEEYRVCSIHMWVKGVNAGSGATAIGNHVEIYNSSGVMTFDSSVASTESATYLEWSHPLMVGKEITGGEYVEIRLGFQSSSFSVANTSWCQVDDIQINYQPL